MSQKILVLSSTHILWCCWLTLQIDLDFCRPWPLYWPWVKKGENSNRPCSHWLIDCSRPWSFPCLTLSPFPPLQLPLVLLTFDLTLLRAIVCSLSSSSSSDSQSPSSSAGSKLYNGIRWWRNLSSLKTAHIAHKICQPIRYTLKSLSHWH